MLPMLCSILTKQDNMSTELAHRQEPVAIILAPTRELAKQIYEEGRKFAARKTHTHTHNQHALTNPIFHFGY